MQEKTYRVKLKIDWRSLFWDLVRSIPVVFLLSLLIAMGTYIYAKQTYAPTYTTTATFVVSVKGSVSTSSANMSKASQLSGVFSEVMDSTALKNLVMEDLSLSSLPVTVTTGVIENTNLMLSLIHILHQTILILAHTEEICLFRGPFDRTAAVRTFAVYNLRFGEKRFARFTVPSFVTALINIALFVELFEDFLYNALMLFVGGADKLVIGRVHQRCV